MEMSVAARNGQNKGQNKEECLDVT